VVTRDQFGNDSTSGLVGTEIVSLSLTGTGSLVGTTVLNIGTGVATFDDLRVDEFGSGKQLTADATGLTSAVSSDFEIEKKTLTATITADDKVYDGDTLATITGRTLVGLEFGDVVSVSGGTANFNDKNVGSGKTVTAAGLIKGNEPKAINYDFDGNGEGTASIIAKPITITPTAGQTKVYSNPDPVFDYTPTPALIDGDGFTGALSRVANEEVGTYAYNIGNLSAGSNYSLTLAPETFAITKRTLNVTATGVDKSYDATTNATVTLLNDRVNGDDVVLEYTATFIDKNVGTRAVNVTGIAITGGADAGNYVLGNTTTATIANITAKPLTVSFTTDANKTYNGNATAAITGRSLEGVIGIEVVDVTGGSANFADKHIGLGKTVTATGFTLTGADKDNYSIGTINTTTGNVNPRPITITAATDSKTYDGTTSSDETPMVTSTFSPPIAEGDTANFIQTYDTKNVDTGKTLTPSGLVNDGNSGNNYAYTFVNNTNGEITVKTLNVTAQPDTKTYDGTISSGVAPVVDALETGDTITTAPIQKFDTKGVDTGKTLTPSGLVIDDGNGGVNYSVVYNPNNVGVITAKNLTVSGAASIPKTYDGNEDAQVNFSGADLNGIVPGEEALVELVSSGYSAEFDNKNVGTEKEVTVSGLTLDGAGASNYSLIQPILNDGAITAKTLTVTATGVNKVYDANTTATVTLSDDRVDGDNVVLTHMAAFNEPGGKNVGTSKPVSVTGIDITGGADADNYILGNTTAETTADITPAPLIATITASNKVYDGNTSATITGRTLDGVIGSDNVVANEDGTATFFDKNVGTGKTVSAVGITIDGVDAGNYSYDGTAEGTADINPLEITITPDAGQSKVYGQLDPTFTYTNTPDLIGGDAFFGALSRAEGENVDTYAFAPGTLSAGGNYALTLVSGTFEITQRPITVSAVTDNRVYNGTTNSAATPAITVGSLAFSDTAGFTQTYDNKNVGTGKTLTPAGIVNDGNNGGNYNVTFLTNATGVITEKELTVSGLSAANKTYDGTTAADVSGTPALVGVEGADDVSLAGVAEGEFNTANAGTVQVEIISLSLTGGDASNYTLTQPVLEAEILPLEITGSFTTENKVYDGNTNAAILTQSLDGVLPADEGKVILTGGAADFADANVANGITVTASGMTLSGSAAGNYTLTSVDTATANITQLKIVVTPDAGQSKVYGQDDPDFTYTNNPALIGGDAFFGALSRAEGENVGIYEYELGSLTAGGNYSLTLETETFEIVKAAPVITWENPADIVYGAALSETELNATADVDGTFVYTPVSGTVLNAGAGQTLSTTFTPTDTVNYGSVTKQVLITVTPASLTVTAGNKSKEYGASDPALTYTHSELVNNDTDAVFSGSLVRDSGEDVGEYDINQGTLSAGSNYKITYNAGTLTIEDTVAPTILSHTPSLNALNISPTTPIVVTFSEAVVVENSDVSFSPAISDGFTITNSGTSVVTITPNDPLADNTTYTITLNGVADVNDLPLPTYSNIKFTTATNYSINLNANASGWNLISLPVVPSNTAISAVLGSAVDNIAAVWTYDPTNPNAVNGWLVYVPGNSGTNNLDIMTAGFGYWVSVTDNANLAGSGTLLIAGPTSPPSRSLQNGWNLIGYYQLPNENSSTPVNAFASLGGSYTGLWGFDNATGFFKSVTEILPGDAFWISLPSAKPYTPSNL